MKLVDIEVMCHCCDKEYVIKVYEEDYKKYNNGTIIQNAFPYLSDDDRELILSQTCSRCFDKLFKR